jgi:hypothetical protein
MRITKRQFVLSALLLAVLAGLVALSLPGPRPVEVPLPDGSVLRLEQIRYGRWERPRFGGTGGVVKQKLRQWWLRYKYGSRFGGLAAGSSTWGTDYEWHPERPALQLWITRQFPNKPNASGVLNRINVDAIQIVDEDGCVFPATQTGGTFADVVANDIRNAGTMEVNWFTFEAFPRREKQLRLQVFEYNPQRKLLTEVKIPNPALKSARPSVPSPPTFPMVKRAGEVEFTLKGVTIKDNYKDFLRGEWLFGHPHEIVADLDAIDGGQPVTNREALDFELRDASGNFASKMYENSLFLCPRQESWTLRAKYFGGTNLDGQLAASWRLTGVKVPSPGTISSMNVTNLLQGVSMKVIAVCGPGNVTYSNNLPMGASLLTNTIRKPTRSMAFYSGWPGTIVTTYQLTNVHIAFELGRMTHDQRLTVSAKDDQGRIFEAYAYDWDWGRPGPRYVYRTQQAEPLLMFLDLPADARTVDLTITIRQPRTVEFVFKPPQK